MDYSKFSYTVQKKTDKVCELRKEKAKWKSFCKLATGANFLLLSYILLYNNRYISYATATFDNQKLAKGIKMFDAIIFIAFAVAVVMLYWVVIKYTKSKENYENLRKDLIKTINNKFCTCKDTCVCKDDYIKAMEERGIDLVYS